MSSTLLSSPLEVREAAQWVREGVCDPVIADQIFSLIRQVLETPDRYNALELGLTLHYIRGLSGRHLLDHLGEALSACLAHDVHDRCWMEIANPLYGITPASPWLESRLTVESLRDGVSEFAPLQSLYARPNLGESALALIAELAPPGHPAKQQALRYASAHLSRYTEQSSSTIRLDDDHDVPEAHSHLDWLTSWLWDHLDVRDELTPLLPHAARCVRNSAHRQQALAIRLALIRPEDASRVCQALTSLELTDRQSFSKLLEKQLKRVGKIKLWVLCRQTLLS